MSAEECPVCGVAVGALPYDWSGRPKLMVCFDCEPAAIYCEECQESHRCEVSRC